MEFVNGTRPGIKSLWSLQSSKSEMWAATLTGLGTALTAAWNGAPVLYHGATIKPEKRTALCGLRMAGCPLVSVKGTMGRTRL